MADVIWAVQMSTVEFHPWNTRTAHVERPDEWRIDLDPQPGAGFAQARQVAAVVQEVLAELGAVGWPKTSGGRGLHIYVRIEPRWGFTLATVPERFARLGDVRTGIDDAVFSLEPLLEWADRDEREHIETMHPQCPVGRRRCELDATDIPLAGNVRGVEFTPETVSGAVRRGSR